MKKSTMKKVLALLLVTMMLFSLAACGTDKQANNDENALVVDTKILKEADDKMLNTYSAIAVNSDAPFVDADGNAVADVYVNTAGADALVQWLLSEEALKMAGEYGVAEYGEYLFYVLDNAPNYTGEIASATEDTKTIRLSTTTSVNDSGLLGYLLPAFEDAYGYTVEVQSAGTGKAIAAAKAGNQIDRMLDHYAETDGTQKKDKIYNGMTLGKCVRVHIFPPLSKAKEKSPESGDGIHQRQATGTPKILLD